MHYDNTGFKTEILGPQTLVFAQKKIGVRTDTLKEK